MEKKPSWLHSLFGQYRSSAEQPSKEDGPLGAGVPLAQPSTPQPNRHIYVPPDGVPVVWKVGDVIINEYEVQGILGQGGMGVVYKVRVLNQNRYLAVKSPRPEVFTKPGGKEDFVREALTWVHLADHPNIVECDFVQTLGGIPRIFMKYVEGGSLAEWIRSGRLYDGGHYHAMERILDVAIQFAWGLHAAHEQGLVHQDIKPANVMMTNDGIAMVTDFGLAKARVMAGEHPREGVEQSILVSAGGMTPAYCSPEQAARRPLSHKTDIWSWGVSVLEMFVGEVTWMAGVVAPEALAHHQPQHAAIPLMPPGVSKVLSKCFEPQPEDRPATMRDVAMQLQEIYTHMGGKLYPRNTSLPSVQRANRLYRQGLSLSQLERYEEALLAYEQAIRLDPASVDAHYEKGFALRALGRYEEAMAAYEQAIRLDPASVDAHYEKGVVLYALGRYEEAMAAYEQAIRLDPTFAKAYCNKGVVLSSLGRYEEAVAAYEQAIHFDPAYAVAYCNKGHGLRELGRDEEALLAFKQAIRFDPAFAQAYYGKGIMLHALGRYEKAVAAYEQAIRLEPSFADAYNNKGTVLHALGRDEEAVTAYEQVNRLEPAYALAYFNKGDVLQDLGRDEEALLAFEQAIRLDSADVKAHYCKGIALQKLGRYEEALLVYEQAIHLEPSFAELYNKKGVVLYALGRYKKAVAAYEQAIHLEPSFAETYCNKGVVLHALGRYKKAVAAYEQAIHLDPAYAEAYYNKGVVLYALERHEEALLAFEQAIRFDPAYANA